MPSSIPPAAAARLRDESSRPSSRASGRRAGSVYSQGAAPPPYAAPLQVDPFHLIDSEILAVASAIRKSAKGRSSSSYFSSSSGAPNGSWDQLLQSTGSSALGLTSYAAEAAERTLAADYKNDSTAARQQRRLSSLGVSLTKRQLPGSVKGKEVAEGRSARTPAHSGGEAVGSLERFARDDSESGLLAAFAILKAQLREVSDLAMFPLPLLVSPFVKVILSPRTSGAITSAGLQAIDRFLAYGIIPIPPVPEFQPGAQIAITEIAHAISHCRFEASDPVVDELVLLRILSVMRELVCGSASHPEGVSLADALGNESICEMMETGLSMCCQTRLSGEWAKQSFAEVLLPMPDVSVV